MNTIFMNSENSRTSDPHRLLLNLTDKVHMRRKDKYIALSNLSIYYTNPIRTINSKLQPQHGVKSLNYLIDHIRYQIFNIILNIY